MAFYLGIDAGGTKTDCALADETRVLARTQNGSIKPLRVSAAQAEANMRALLEEIGRQSGVDLKQVSVSCVGTAGVRFPQTKEWMDQIISRHASGEMICSIHSLVCGNRTPAVPTQETDTCFKSTLLWCPISSSRARILASA